MCQYWKKQHTCTHLSDRPYVEMCRNGHLTNTVCRTISDDPVPRPSHFPCWPCIKHSAHLEASSKRLEALAAQTVRGMAAKEKVAAEVRGKEERVRREAREKAERERVAEERAKVQRERETERARKEGGAWIVAEGGSGKKKRSGKDLAASPGSPMGKVVKGIVKENQKSGEVVGRAGVWGPKKILKRESEGVVSAVEGAKN